MVIATAFTLWRGALAGVAVVGGGALVGLVFWAIKGTVDGLILSLPRHSGGAARVMQGEAAAAGQFRRKSTGFSLVKFFTRHAIVALAAYGMMVRLHLDPLGLLAGVSSLGVAVGVEALRDLRWRRFL
ncbi:MAG: hypothetical protein K2Y23_23540 [Cyanobacteria bacterium]|nr:hypothetical protein [Cyanobacteriota bacterium]